MSLVWTMSVLYQHLAQAMTGCASTRKFEFRKRKELTGTGNSEEEPGWHQIFPEQGGRADVRASGNVPSDTIAFLVLYS